MEEKIYVVGEGINRIEQHLIANKSVGIDQIKEVYSHPTAIAQCQKFLKDKNWEKNTRSDTAGSVLSIKEKKSTNACAIASERSAKLYDMQIIKKNIEDNSNNFTRFFMISRESYIDLNIKDANKTSIAFELRNGLNSLYPYLGLYIENGVNILNLQYRPSKNKVFEHVVYLDLLPI